MNLCRQKCDAAIRDAISLKAEGSLKLLSSLGMEPPGASMWVLHLWPHMSGSGSVVGCGWVYSHVNVAVLC